MMSKCLSKAALAEKQYEWFDRNLRVANRRNLPTQLAPLISLLKIGKEIQRLKYPILSYPHLKERRDVDINSFFT